MIYQFDSGATATFSLIGGAAKAERNIHIVGTKGEIRGRCEDNKFTLYQCVREGDRYYTKETVVDVSAEIDKTAWHSNADICLMQDYVRYLNGDNSSISITAIDDSVNGHQCVYAAEKSRRAGVVVQLNNEKV